MELWQLWVLAAIALFGVEMFTADMMVGSVGIGCLCSAVAARFGAPPSGQLVAFSVGTLVLMLGVRPRVKDLLYRSADTRKSGVQALVGQTAVVVDPIGRTSPGRVRIGAEEWRAMSDDAPLDAGREVVVMGVEAATLQVRGKQESKED